MGSKRAEQGLQSLLGSQSHFMGVFSNDFAAVDVREELCYHSLTEKANSEGLEKVSFKANDHAKEIAGKK